MVRSKLIVTLFAASVVVACSSSSNPAGDGGGDTGTGIPDGSKPADAGKDTGTGKDVVTGPMCPTPDSTAAMNYKPMYIPPNMIKNDCTSVQIQGYYDNCQDDMTATTMKCQAWGMANMTCAQCLESATTDATWGPLVIGGGIISLNISGCVDLKGDKTCAQNYQAADGCTRAACDQVCPVMDNQSFADWQKCVQTAETGVCKSYQDKVTMTCANDASAAFSYCSNFGMTFKDGIFFYASLFCGGGGG